MHQVQRISFFILLIVIGFFSIFLQSSQAQESLGQRSLVTVLTIDGAIGPGVQTYVARGIKESAKLKADAIVLKIDTPGGLSSAMREIIKHILSSSIPVIGYVAPSGAHAASAGTFILYATHIAAMAPGTNLGAATPVNIISTPQNDKKSDAKLKKNDQSDGDDESAKKSKAMNDAKAYIRTLAQLRNRNVAWAELAVSKAESISADEALKENVINLISPSVSDLLKRVNGQSIEVNNSVKKILIKDPVLKYINPDWREKILHVITNPSIAYILLMIGVYGLFFEFMNPGYILPGVAGAIGLLLALYAFQMLPINYVGFSLILLGIVFMVAEVFVPSFGALGFGGIIGFLIGSFLLLDTKVPGFTLPWQLIIGVTVSTAIFMIGLLQLIIRSRWRKVVTGAEGMVGQVGVIEKDGDQYWVKLMGERWHVKSDHALSDQQEVSVVKVEGLTLIVK